MELSLELKTLDIRGDCYAPSSSLRFFFKLNIFLFDVYGFFARMYLCTTCVWYQKSPKGASDPLGLEVWMVVSSPLDTGKLHH